MSITVGEFSDLVAEEISKRLAHQLAKAVVEEMKRQGFTPSTLETETFRVGATHG